MSKKPVRVAAASQEMWFALDRKGAPILGARGPGAERFVREQLGNAVHQRPESGVTIVCVRPAKRVRRAA